MAIAISHGTSADGTFSSAGATAWNAAHSISGLSSTSGALLYSTDATTLAQDSSFTWKSVAGQGLMAAVGTVTADGALAEFTRTNNNAAVTKGFRIIYNDGTSAAGFLPFQVLGGAAGATNLFSVDKTGIANTPLGVNLGTGDSVVAPTYTGIHSRSGGTLNFMSNGTECATFSTTAFLFYQTVPIQFGSAGVSIPDVGINRGGANQLVFSSSSSVGGGVTTRAEINKAVTAFTDGVAKTVFTLTIPNAAHSASYLVRLTGSIGAGGAIGANEASATNCYVVTLTRTAGVNATAAISAAFGAAATNVAGATTVTCTGALAAVSGGVGATNTIDIQATITKGGGASNNHTCVATASLLNANSSGITIS